MKKLKKAQAGTVIGAEQGKKAKNLRRAGVAIPTIGAAAMALKSGINKIKSKKTQKRLEEEYMNDTQRRNAEGAAEFKTGGMVNSNTKVQALKSAGSKGVKSGVNTKASASKRATGRVGGTSAAPKTATPKAKRGGVMRKK
jgi:hypothetical protein